MSRAGTEGFWIDDAAMGSCRGRNRRKGGSRDSGAEELILLVATAEMKAVVVWAEKTGRGDLGLCESGLGADGGWSTGSLGSTARSICSDEIDAADWNSRQHGLGAATSNGGMDLTAGSGGAEDCNWMGELLPVIGSGKEITTPARGRMAGHGSFQTCKTKEET